MSFQKKFKNNRGRFFEQLQPADLCYTTVLFFTSLVLRWGYTLVGNNRPLWGDVQFYDKLAVLFANKFYGTSFIPFFPEANLLPYEHLALVRPPLYAVFLGSVYAVFGHSLTAASLANGVLSAATVVIIYILARELFGGTAGLIAGVYAAFYPPFIYVANVVYPETLYSLCIIITILIIVRFGRNNTLLLPVLGGLAAGLAVNARPNFLAAVPALGFAVWLNTRLSALKRATAVALFTLSVAITLVPPTVYNYFAYDIPTPIGLNGGYVLYLGNNATSTINDYDTDDRIRTCREAEKTGNDAVKDAYFRRKAVDYISEHPWRTAKLWTLRFFYFFHFDPGLRQPDFMPLNVLFKWVNLVFYGPILLLWVFGSYILRNRRQLASVQLTVATAAIASIIFYVRTRYRLPVEPLMIVVAAGTTWFIITRFLSTEKRKNRAK